MSTFYRCDKCNKILKRNKMINVSVNDHIVGFMEGHLDLDLCEKCAKPIVAFLNKQLK